MLEGRILAQSRESLQGPRRHRRRSRTKEALRKFNAVQLASLLFSVLGRR